MEQNNTRAVKVNLRLELTKPQYKKLAQEALDRDTSMKQIVLSALDLYIQPRERNHN